MERRQISERTKAGLAVRKQQGLRVSAQAPYGYCFRKTGQIIVNPHEKRILEEMKRLRAEGLTLKEIDKELKKQKMLNRNGKPFGFVTIGRLLKRMEKDDERKEQE